MKMVSRKKIIQKMQQLLDLLPKGKRKDKLNKDLLNIKLGKSNKLL
tara:strand:+ start:518 stop:655 length:138 start_codon:yes stop_codon:yes gene_type:complete